jgi:hypothetical protein
MKLVNTSHYNNWYVAYSPYVDTLHVYQDSFNKKNKDEMLNKDVGIFFAIYDSKTSQLLLFEMNQASKYFENIEKMDKEHIIRGVKKLAKNYDT